MTDEIIVEIIVGPDEVLRVTLEGSRRQRIAMRLWFKPRMGGAMRPSNSGLTFPEHKAEALATAILAAKRGAGR